MMELNEQRATLFVEYLSDLGEFNPSREPPNYKAQHDMALQYINDPNFEWIDIYEDKEDADRPIGFLILGRNIGCHPDADVFIAGAFVTYAYRNLGYMTALLLDKVGKEKVCCYFTTPGNDYAKRFFNHFFLARGYSSVRLDRSYIKKEEAGTAFFAWSK